MENMKTRLFFKKTARGMKVFGENELESRC